MNITDNLVKLLDNFPYDYKDYVGNNKVFIVDDHIELANYLIANGVTISSEIEGLRADNERLRDMWAKTVSDLSKCQAENIQYKRMFDNTYEMIGKMTDR